jgi:hypothetical protein
LRTRQAQSRNTGADKSVRPTRSPRHPGQLLGRASIATFVASVTLVAALLACLLGAGATAHAVSNAGAHSASAVSATKSAIAADRLNDGVSLGAGAMAGAATRFATMSDNLPADCIPSDTGPPGGPYELGIVGTVTNGVLTAGVTKVANINVKFCGIVTIVPGTPPCNATGTVDSPPDGQIFGSLTADLTLIPGMQPSVPFTAIPGTITGGFQCSPNSSQLIVTANATVSGTTGLYGLSCTVGPFSIALSGALSGPISEPDQYATVTLAGNDFSIPAVQSSPSCTGAVPANLNELAGLPIAPGGASASLPASVTLYQPAS